MVERSLSMREVPGSMPGFSNYLFFLFFFFPFPGSNHTRIVFFLSLHTLHHLEYFFLPVTMTFYLLIKLHPFLLRGTKEKE